MNFPSGTVTFLFTDVEGSTKLLHQLGDERYAQALAEHRRVIREACASQDGVEVDTQGDAFFFAFGRAREALAAAREVTSALAAGPIRVRIGLHTGTPLLTGEGYVGGDVHRAARVAAAAHGGQVVLSQATRALVEDGIELKDLGEHRFKDLGAPERVYQLGAADFPPLKSLYRSNLPIPASSFLGRERELTEVVGLLRGDTRLLTLTGPGGTGKTRLALQAAAEASDEYPDGVYWVPLAPLRDPKLVLETAAQALGVSDGLADHIAGKRLLLLFDNFEHVVEAAGGLGDVLVTCPNLKILATSREPLHLTGEQEHPVPPLAPEEGVGFFLARARAAKPDFERDEAVPEICRRLDDLPLALELAAARVKALSSARILERLDERLGLLTGGARDLPERQRTLRATIEWSYDLLADDEQRLFARLSVFAGGCTLEAAEEVCRADLDTLQSLVDKSLLRHTGERYWMLETIREYAVERLEEAGEAEGLKKRHAQFFLVLSEELEPPIMGSVDESSETRLRAEADNLRAAIEFFSKQPEPSGELRLIGSLYRFWRAPGLAAEGRRLAVQALQRSEGADRRLRMKVLTVASVGAMDQADYATAAMYEEERLQIARLVGDKLTEASALNHLGVVASEDGDPDTATSLFESSAELAAEIRNDDMLLGVRGNLAELAVDRGEYQRARVLLEDMLAVSASRGNTWVTAHNLEGLGRALVGLGELQLAEQRFCEGLAMVHVVPLVAANCLDGLAAVTMARGDAARAARLTGAADAFRPGEVGAWTQWRTIAEETEASARLALGDQAWEAERVRGAAMSLDDAVAYALDSGK